MKLFYVYPTNTISLATFELAPLFDDDGKCICLHLRRLQTCRSKCIRTCKKYCCGYVGVGGPQSPELVRGVRMGHLRSVSLFYIHIYIYINGLVHFVEEKKKKK